MPRWVTFGDQIAVEARFPDAVLSDLEGRGHKLLRLAQWDGAIARSQVIAGTPGGGWAVASDLRGEGVALAMLGPMSPGDVTHVFIAGIGNSGPGHWQRLWHEKLGGVWLEHDDWLRPNRDTWVSDLQKAIWRIPGPQVVIAHSLGCLLLAEWVRDHDDPTMAGAFLVSVPDIERPEVPGDRHRV